MPPRRQKQKQAAMKTPSKSTQNRAENEANHGGELRIEEQMTKEEEEFCRAQMRFHAQKVAPNMKVSVAMEQSVKKATKRELWKSCKFIKNEAFLHKATNFVMNKL